MSTDVAASSRRRQGLLMQTAFKLETVQVSNDAASKAFLSRGAFATKGQSSSHWSERRADMRREIQVTSNTSTVRYFSLFPVFGLLLFFRHISTWLAVRIITPRPSKGYFVLSEGCCALVSAIPASRVSSPSVTIPPPLTRAYAAASASLSSTSSSSVTSLSSPTFHLYANQILHAPPSIAETLVMDSQFVKSVHFPVSQFFPAQKYFWSELPSFKYHQLFSFNERSMTAAFIFHCHFPGIIIISFPVSVSAATEVTTHGADPGGIGWGRADTISSPNMTNLTIQYHIMPYQTKPNISPLYITCQTIPGHDM